MQLIMILVFIISVMSNTVLATEPSDQVTQDFTAILVQCISQNPVGVAELELLANKTMPDGDGPKCLFACAYKQLGTMDDQGRLNVNGLRDLTSKYFPNDAEKIKMSEKFIEACQSVNDEPVSDGNRGCDRAGLLFKCSAKNVPDLDFI